MGAPRAGSDIFGDVVVTLWKALNAKLLLLLIIWKITGSIKDFFKEYDMKNVLRERIRGKAILG